MLNKKNLRYCQVTADKKTYELFVAVDNLDQVDNVLQDWALAKLGTTLALPEALLVNKDASEVLTAYDVDSFCYMQSTEPVYRDKPAYAGLAERVSLPTSLNDKGKFVLPETKAFLYSEYDFEGFIGRYNIPSAEMQLHEGINYIGIAYNFGKPAWFNDVVDTSISFSERIPVARVLFIGGKIFIVPYDSKNGIGLVEKMARLEIFGRFPFEIAYDFRLKNTGLNVLLSGLSVKHGSELIFCAEADTAKHEMFLYFKDASDVTQVKKAGQLNNLQYQGANGLEPLAEGEYVINYIFRAVCKQPLLLTVLSEKYSSLEEAKAAPELDYVSCEIEETAVCVGRFIVAYNSTEPVCQKVRRLTFG